jgi:hypothetical protein
MTGTRESLITGLGFIDITEQVLKDLRLKTTKKAKAVVDKINRMDGYKVYLNSDLGIFTVYSPRLVTQEEVDQIKRLLKKGYKKVGTIMGENGLWSEWIKNEGLVRQLPAHWR